MKLHRWLTPDALAFGSEMLRRGVRFVGQYPTWEAAAQHASGYDEASILERTVAATEAVRSGAAAFDRDGVSFAEPYYPHPLIAGLLDSALRAGGRLSVIDFGGALGSTYFQVRPWLQAVNSITWMVVEQAHYVDIGQARFETDQLKFRHTIGDCLADRPTAAVLSGVLQYLPDPWSVLTSLKEAALGSILITRMPVVDGDKSVITVQKVPATIVASSYPARLLTRADLLRPLVGYRILDEHEDGQDRPVVNQGRLVRYRGFVALKE